MKGKIQSTNCEEIFIGNMKKLSVIIVTYKNIEIVRNCLDSIQRYNDIGESLEVIVSDNSEDNTLFDTIRAEYDWIKIIKNENKGFGAGNNRGYEVSTGEYLLFLNPDTILIEPVFGFAVNEFEKHKDLALFGVQLLDAQRKKNTSFLMMDRFGICATLWVKVCRALNWFWDGKMFISGANLFVRRESFEQAGRFDEKIFMYKEESDLIKRIKQSSTAKKTKFFPRKHIIHLDGGTETKNTRQVLVQLGRLLDTDRYYAAKWGMDVKRVYRQKRRYERFKLLCYRLFASKEKRAYQKSVVDLLSNRLEQIT